MWNAYRYWDRLKDALRKRDIDPDRINLSQFANLLIKRGLTDRKMNNVVWGLLHLLEPSQCTMTHCKNYYTHSSCSCNIEKAPGRCKIFNEYKKRKANKALKQMSRQEAPGHRLA